MERLTDCAQGYCELYCKSYGLCRLDPEICARKNEAALYAKLKDYEITGLEPKEIERILDAYGRGMTLRQANSERLRLIHGISTDQLRELVQADKDGQLVVLPCKVGDMVYQTDGVRIYSHTIRKLIYDAGPFDFDESAIGKTVFLTHVEAEAALRKDGAACD